MPQVRVYELAKELGVESKVVLTKLKEMGEFVKSASSTVEPPVVKRFTDQFGAELKAAADKGAAKKAAPKPAAKAAPQKPAEKPAEQPAEQPAAKPAPADTSGLAVALAELTERPDRSGTSTTHQVVTPVDTGPSRRRSEPEAGYSADEHPMSTQQ